MSGPGRTVLVLALAFALATAATWLVVTRPFAPPAWEAQPPHPAGIYVEGPAPAPDDPAFPVLSPFHLEVDPMERIILLNMEGDPDRTYIGFEPQAFDDEVHGRGLLVIGWRADRRVDVFHEPGLRLDEETYGIAGEGLHAMEARRFEPDRFEIGPLGADVDIGFEELEGRPVRLRVLERDPRPRRPIGLLAPMGAAATDPPAFPLVYLHDFDFVRRTESEVLIEVDGRAHRPDRLPVPMGGARVYFLRYSPDPFIVTWNPEHDGPLEPLELEAAAPGAGGSEGPWTARDGEVVYDLSDNRGHPEIRRMRRAHGDHAVVVDFEPAVPRLTALRDGTQAEGDFRITAHPTVGTVTGRWGVEREGDRIRLVAIPTGGWTPNEDQRTVRLMYRLVRGFQQWPATYRWEGAIRTAEPDPAPEPEAPAAPSFHLDSGWMRIP